MVLRVYCVCTDLKRFSPGERFRKLDASVDFPLSDLDLSAYSSPGVRPSPCSYQLYGVINHSGSAYSGHYTASCRHPFTASWHEYNDARYSSSSTFFSLFSNNKLANLSIIINDPDQDQDDELLLLMYFLSLGSRIWVHSASSHQRLIYFSTS